MHGAPGVLDEHLDHFVAGKPPDPPLISQLISHTMSYLHSLCAGLIRFIPAHFFDIKLFVTRHQQQDSTNDPPLPSPI